MPKRVYADPGFAAEMAAIAADRRARFGTVPGTGLPVDEKGQPVQPNSRLTLNNDLGADARTFRSTLRPSGAAR